jgi:SAM-dependent methyltransferase
MRNSLIKLHRILEQFGFNPRRTIQAFRGLPPYLTSVWRYFLAARGKSVLRLYPCLTDWYAEGGETESEYFWQDIYVAKRIFHLGASISKHVDIGSRIDGFVAHVACFRRLEVFDIRPISADIPGVDFRKMDLMALPSGFTDYCDSMSCLHALEHFGLGRYGDPIDPLGHEAGLKNIAALLRPGGRLFLSVPVGRERVEFNAHRVFHPATILALAERNNLFLDQFVCYSAQTGLTEPTCDESRIKTWGNSEYSLGIFEFIKNERNA